MRYIYLHVALLYGKLVRKFTITRTVWDHIITQLATEKIELTRRTGLNGLNLFGDDMYHVFAQIIGKFPYFQGKFPYFPLFQANLGEGEVL